MDAAGSVEGCKELIKGTGVYQGERRAFPSRELHGGVMHWALCVCGAVYVRDWEEVEACILLSAN